LTFGRGSAIFLIMIGRNRSDARGSDMGSRSPVRRRSAAIALAVAVSGILAATAAPVSAAHVTCGSVITTDTTLDGDIGPCPGDALIIGADNVTLDLGGYAVAGAGSGAGVRIAQRTGVEVTNGTIQGFNTGLVLDESDGNHVWDLTVRDNVRQGITVAGSDNNVIEKNDILDNGGDAIRLGLSAGNVISKNVAIGNVFGIGVADFSSGNLVEKNQVTDSVAFGIAVFSASPNNRLVKNSVSGTLAGDGIIVSADSSGTLVDKNVANANASDGIDVANPTTTVARNTANNNGNLGIFAVPGTIDGGGNSASGNGNPAQCVGVSCS
jgi:parallel beta-helix repeat protein